MCPSRFVLEFCPSKSVLELCPSRSVLELCPSRSVLELSPPHAGGRRPTGNMYIFRSYPAKPARPKSIKNQIWPSKTITPYF